MGMVLTELLPSIIVMKREQYIALPEMEKAIVKVEDDDSVQTE